MTTSTKKTTIRGQLVSRDGKQYELRAEIEETTVGSDRVQKYGETTLGDARTIKETLNSLGCEQIAEAMNALRRGERLEIHLESAVAVSEGDT